MHLVPGISLCLRSYFYFVIIFICLVLLFNYFAGVDNALGLYRYQTYIYVCIHMVDAHRTIWQSRLIRTRHLGDDVRNGLSQWGDSL